MEHPEVGLFGLVIVVNSVSGVVFLLRKFALIISWVCWCFGNELEEGLDFLLFFKGSLGDYAEPTEVNEILAVPMMVEENIVCCWGT